MFQKIKSAVSKQFAKMEAEGLYMIDVDRDALWNAYLNGFSDPDFKQEHNCNCCKSFIRQYGGVVSIKDGKLSSIWDVGLVGEYTEAAMAMAKIVHESKVSDIFVSKHKGLGTDSNIQYKDGKTKEWEHFYHELKSTSVTRSGGTVYTIKGNARSTRDVFKRSLDELTIEATEMVLDLISQNSLYRGQEFENLLKTFLKHQKAYAKLDARGKDLYAWEHFKEGGKVRNSAIGTLLIDLSEGKELDRAVASFEAKVAPHNYKRPKALVTKKMIENAEKEIQALGLENSLYRRYATSDDIPVDQVIFLNRDSSKKGGLFAELKESLPVSAQQFSKVEEVSINDFLSKIVPNATNIEVLLESRHTGNLMTLVAPVHADAPSLFKWDNGLSWDYNGGVADSVKEKVKKAGGKVDGELRISLEWHNYDDLDLHVIEPNKNEIWFASKVSRYTNGALDVDMNAGYAQTREPVENVIYPTKSKMLEGRYEIKVNNYSKRESIDTGFNVEVECQGELFTFFCDSPRSGATETVAVIEYSKTKGVTLVKGDATTTKNVRSVDVWGIGTNKFHKVSMIMNSPNHWEREIGNKHTFFILEGCKTEDNTRGMFNEFLKDSLLTHKRLFEMLGSKMKVQESGSQLSGLGFSSTQKDSVIVKVDGKFSRTLKVKF